mmetsp:Transcript_49618/g.106272  ORF Transcript_49618/g.106272 Transcript_49618/m.106272 type:complete len:215 (-) Transcript_49618:2739-3383(-)
MLQVPKIPGCGKLSTTGTTGSVAGSSLKRTSPAKRRSLLREAYRSLVAPRLVVPVLGETMRILLLICRSRGAAGSPSFVAARLCSGDGEGMRMLLLGLLGGLPSMPLLVVRSLVVCLLPPPALLPCDRRLSLVPTLRPPPPLDNLLDLLGLFSICSLLALSNLLLLRLPKALILLERLEALSMLVDRTATAWASSTSPGRSTSASGSAFSASSL